MRISVKQLARWVDFDLDVEELAHRLTMAGLEVEEVVEFGAGHDDIVVGRIEAIEEHPSADRLVVCRVDTGSGELHQIVCGATNMKEGDVVPVALPGSAPPALDFEIGSRKVAGVQSDGMLCAEEELGLAPKSDGLWILPSTLELGTPIFEAMGLRDTYLEIGLTPNRPDCLSHHGVAREVSAIVGSPLSREALDVEPLWEVGEGAISDVASLDVEDPEGCPRYVAAVVENVVVGPSPAWLREMVTAMGMRSINNVVDVTNVVLADIGQPLHAFDLDELDGARIVVRRAREGEKIEAIDHKTYALEPSDLVIADGNKPIAIAGVMGGAGSEVGESTSRILLECAYFDPGTVRSTSKKLGIHSESSHRFERGIDPAATRRNAAYALDLLMRTQTEDAVVRRGILEHDNGGWSEREIVLSTSLVTRILGIEMQAEEVAELLGSIDIGATAEGEGVRCAIPTFRPDLERPIDLVEEVARLKGYDAFDAELPDASMGSRHELLAERKHDETIIPRRRLRQTADMRKRLLAAGLHEAVSYSFMSESDFDLLGLPADDVRRRALRVANPLTQDQALMRTTIVPAMLRALADNVAQRNEDVGLFEITRRFDEEGDAGATLAILATGASREHFTGSNPWDFHDMKGLLESLLGGVESSWRRPANPEPYLHPGVQAEWIVGGEVLATVGQVHPHTLRTLDVEIEAPVFVAEVDLDRLLASLRPFETFRAYPRFPAVRRDFALLYDATADWSALEDAVGELAQRDGSFGEIFQSMRLFDIYAGEQVPEGKRSLAIEVVYRAADRTLTDDEVSKADDILLGAIEKKTGARLR